jgi:signal transduction histidine kinase
VLDGCLSLVGRASDERKAEVCAEMLPICKREMQRLLSIVERLLEFRELSQEEKALECQPVDVGVTVAQVEQAVAQRYPDKNIEFISAVDPAAQYVEASAEHVDIVVQELMDNAVKFCAETPIRVEVTVKRRDDGALLVSVTDNGPGIPHEYLDRVFDGYVQIEEHLTGQVPGLGLGLRVVKEVVEAYGGQVGVHSKIGQGTTMWVTLGASERLGSASRTQ